MILLFQNKIKIYKKFNLDIWGLVLLSSKVTSFASKHFFKFWTNRQDFFNRKNAGYVFSMFNDDSDKKRYFFKKTFVTVRVLKLFYLTLTYKKFVNFSKKAAKKDGLFQSHYCYFLENRVVSLIYRANIASSFFHAIDVINTGCVYVNGLKAFFVNQFIKLGSMIFIKEIFKNFIKYNILYTMKKKFILYNTPRYLYVNFALLFFFNINYPQERDLFFPTKLNIFRINGFY